jgi:hypothetical protein
MSSGKAGAVACVESGDIETGSYPAHSNVEDNQNRTIDEQYVSSPLFNKGATIKPSKRVKAENVRSAHALQDRALNVLQSAVELMVDKTIPETAASCITYVYFLPNDLSGRLRDAFHDGLP